MSNNVLVRVLAQYSENYAAFNPNWDGQKQSWKVKGEQWYDIEVETHLFAYEQEICIEAIKQILKEDSNLVCKVEYVKHEVVFCKPESISKERFEAIVNKMLTPENSM